MTRGVFYGRVVTVSDPSVARRFYTMANLDKIRARARVDDPEVYEFIRGIFYLGYAGGTDPRNSAQPPSESKQDEPLDTRAAAAQLEIGAAAVRKALREHRLAGTQHPDGRWTTTPQAIRDYRAARAS